jgi:hypothetical protein
MRRQRFIAFLDALLIGNHCCPVNSWFEDGN